MAVFLSSLNSILGIVLIIATGFYLARQGWFTPPGTQLIARLVTTVSLPCLMVYNISHTFTRDKLIELSSGLILPAVAAVICFFLGKLAAQLFNVRIGRRGLLRSTFYVSNTIFIGLPLNLALFGDSSLPYVLIYYIVNTIAFWVFATHAIATDNVDAQGGDLFSAANFKKIFSPPLLGFLVAIVIVLLQIKLPLPIMQVCYHLGAMTTPLSMLFIGISISNIKLDASYFDKDIFVALFARFVISPLMVLLLSYYIPLGNNLMLKVFIIQAAMPVMAQSALIAKVYNVDAPYAAMLTTISTLIAIFVIPFYMWLFAYVLKI